MATGPEHYREAEYRLDQALNDEGGSNAERYNLAAAQIHATLALAAATALASTGVGEADLGEWTALICEPDDSYEAAAPACCVAAEQVEHDEDCESRLAAEQDADRDAADTAMSASERFEHDQADEFAQDAADAERWAEENAANQYDDAHYNTDDDEQDDDEDGDL